MDKAPLQGSWAVGAFGLAVGAAAVLVFHNRLAPAMQPFALRLIPLGFFWVIYRHAGIALRQMVETENPVTFKPERKLSRWRLWFSRQPRYSYVAEYDDIRRRLELACSSSRYLQRMLSSLSVPESIAAEYLKQPEQRLTIEDLTRILDRLEEQL